MGLEVLTYNNKITFHAVGFDKGVERKGVEHKVGLLGEFLLRLSRSNDSLFFVWRPHGRPPASLHPSPFFDEPSTPSDAQLSAWQLTWLSQTFHLRFLSPFARAGGDSAR